MYNIPFIVTTTTLMERAGVSGCRRKLNYRASARPILGV
jgi:hypothetical protein